MDAIIGGVLTVFGAILGAVLTVWLTGQGQKEQLRLLEVSNRQLELFRRQADKYDALVARAGEVLALIESELFYSREQFTQETTWLYRQLPSLQQYPLVVAALSGYLLAAEAFASWRGSTNNEFAQPDLRKEHLEVVQTAYQRLQEMCAAALNPPTGRRG